MLAQLTKCAGVNRGSHAQNECAILGPPKNRQNLVKLSNLSTTQICWIDQSDGCVETYFPKWTE